MIRSKRSLGCDIGQALALHDGRRRVPVVEQRGVRDKTLLAHQFLGVETPVRTTEADVTLCRNLACNPVIRHIVSFDAGSPVTIFSRFNSAFGQCPGCEAAASENRKDRYV